jgi:hypothetical protein
LYNTEKVEMLEMAELLPWQQPLYYKVPGTVAAAVVAEAEAAPPAVLV